MDDRARLKDLSRPLGLATRARQGRAFGGPSSAPRAPAIVKSVSRQHGRQGARSTLRYVARLRESDARSGDAEPQLFDEWGDPVPRGLAFEALDRWQLDDEQSAESDLTRVLRKADADAEWRRRLLAWRAGEAGFGGPREFARTAGVRARGVRAAATLREAADLAVHFVRPEDLPPERRYARVATRHLAVSVPLSDERQAGLFEVTVAAFIRETFATEGRRVFWAVHREHGKEVHAHLLVHNTDEFGRALRFGRGGEELDRLREALARHARGVGLDIEATRHADRPELVAAVVDGAARPRSHVRWSQNLGRGAERLAEVGPAWLLTHGLVYAERLQSGGVVDPQPVKPAPGDRGMPRGYEALVGYLSGGSYFRGPAGGDQTAVTVEAVGRFAALREEEVARTGKDTVSRWFLLNSPVLFGAVRRGRRPNRTVMTALLRQLPEPAAVVKPAEVPAEQLAAIVRRLQAVQSSRSATYRRAVDILRLARHREQLAERLESFGGAEDLKAAVQLRTSASEMRRLRVVERRSVDPSQDSTVGRDHKDRGRGR